MDLIQFFVFRDKETLIPQGVKIIAYEPIFAIGTGNPDTPENAEEIAEFINQKIIITSFVWRKCNSKILIVLRKKPNIEEFW